MYIKSLKINNIRCFEDVSITFSKPGESKLLLGENGDGKSTILRCLAMGLCDESSAAALFRELPGEFIRRPKGRRVVPKGDFGTIEVELDASRGYTYNIVTTIQSLDRFEVLFQDVKRYKAGKLIGEFFDQIDFPWHKTFVVSYGPGLRTRANMDFQHYLPVDAVYPLFSYETPLQNPHSVLLKLMAGVREKAEKEIRKENFTSLNKEDLDQKIAINKDIKEKELLKVIRSLMKELLDLKRVSDFKVTATGIRVSGHWGTAELDELGDGFQATITWVLDLLSWWFLKNNGETEWDLSKIKGIVIIDEIEQHLHPKWQKRILAQLRAKFKSIQFIVTTHSPLVASANDDIDVCLLRNGSISEKHTYGWLVEDVYQMMGLKSSRPRAVNEAIANYKELYFKKLTKKLSRDGINELERAELFLTDLGLGDVEKTKTQLENLHKFLLLKKGDE